MLTAFVLTLLAATTTPPLRVEVTSPKSRLSIFEPVKLAVRATALRAVIVPAISNTGRSPAIEVWIDYGSGFTQYRDVDDAAGLEGAVGGDRSLSAGEYFVKTVVLVQGRIGDQPAVPFSTAGRYPLRIIFRARPQREGAAGVVLGESNAVTFEVVGPDAESQTVVQRLRTQPSILRGGVDNPGYDSLVKEFPSSPYLQWGKYAIALEEGHRIHNGRYPDTDEKFAEMAQGSPLAPPLYRQLASELLEADTWGQFDEERLKLAAEDLERAGDFAEAKNVWAEILEAFPGSEAAEEAKHRIDTTPPSLQLAASPPMLWPPSHNLEPITVAVTVTDDTDPSPRVTLVSITCSDSGAAGQGQQKGEAQAASQGCDAADIADAAYGSDDREFRLRAERVGFGPGRLYTITYQAFDAVGNKATATTTVTVARDQGIAKRP